MSGKCNTGAPQKRLNKIAPGASAYDCFVLDDTLRQQLELMKCQ